MDRSIDVSRPRSIISSRSQKSSSFLCFIVFFYLSKVVECSIVSASRSGVYHLPPKILPPEIIRWGKDPATNSRKPGRPVNVMTDVINDLGVKILDRYLENNGNVAFSPSGLGFVLVALYEGAAGSSAREISQVLGLPRDRRVTRIGLRDIHRRLRSYLNADAFLGGLTLNRDDINLRPDYEDVLRFYGFDVSDSGDEINSTTTDSPILNNSTSPASTDPPSSGSDANVTTDGNNIDATTPSGMANETVQILDANMTTDVNSAMMMNTSAMPQIISGMNLSNSANLTNSANLINSTNLTNSTNSPNATISGDMNLMPNTTNSTSDVSSSMPISNGMADTNSSSANFVNSLPNGATNPNGTPPSNASSVTQAPTSDQSSTTSSSLTGTVQTMLNLTDSGNSTVIDAPSTGMNASSNTTVNSLRKRRGIFHGHPAYYADDGIWFEELTRLDNDDDYPSQDEDIIADSKRPTEIAFLVNGCDYSRVTAAAYTAFLPFCYFPGLQASLLEFPLDDSRYKIMVMLPSDENGTRRLARILSTKPITLRNLRRSLQPSWVTAVIPSFMLRGFVTLTPHLQKLGILDVFDPRAADLTPMSPDLGVYARDIQQSIGVNIRNTARKPGIGGADGGDEKEKNPPQSQGADDSIRKSRSVQDLPPFYLAGGAISPTSGNYGSYPRIGTGLYGRAPPVPFVVDRPFLYFIVDDETSVTLLAGRIDDPLNSRML